MEDKVYPFRLRYKGYIITQTEGEVLITKNKQEVLSITTTRMRTAQELIELFNFNKVYIEGVE
jgi:hypothetical protein